MDTKTEHIIREAYARYHKPQYLPLDPLYCVRNFPDLKSRECIGLIVAFLSYGKIEQIIATIMAMFNRINNDGTRFIQTTTLKQKRKILQGLRHRFNDGADIALLCEVIRLVLIEYGSIESLFYSHLHQSDDIGNAIDGFMTQMRHFGSKLAGYRRSFRFLLPSPADGSACKRMAMYLRWMVRPDDGIDLGIWKRVGTQRLIVPVDTHIARISRHLKLTNRTTADWVMAQQITEQLRQIEPDDPVRFDFSLCRLGMHNQRSRRNGSHNLSE
ncbi:MAG: TIGR02757 family protein [Chitinivibrionales bacterium]|nr:TIGR02757 family protein [Chitinivibrionales bacterium]